MNHRTTQRRSSELRLAAPLGLRTLIACTLCVAALVTPGVVAAAGPCGELALVQGRVRTARPLVASETLGAADAACLEAAAGALAGLKGLRSVTISVRLADAARTKGAGLRIGETYSAALVKAGLRRSRISVVAPPAPHGTEGQVTLAYTERRSNRPVAQLEALHGKVTVGTDLAALRPAVRGARLSADSFVVTAAGASAALGLADGSRVRLAQGSRLLIGRMHLNDELERVVRLELQAGDLEADVRGAGPSSVFAVSTRTGVAGVRGTRFRLGVLADGGTRLETLEGVVELGSGQGAPVKVSKGNGALLGKDGAVGDPVALLPAPLVEGPKQGELAKGAALRWKRVDGAASYRIDLARDAEFLYGVQTHEAATATLTLPDELEQGKWFWRVAALSRDGFEGATSKVYGVTWRP